MIWIASSLPLYEGRTFEPQRPVCCKHFVQHDNCSLVLASNLLASENHFDSVSQVARRAKSRNKLQTGARNSSSSASLLPSSLGPSASTAASTPSFGSSGIPLRNHISTPGISSDEEFLDDYESGDMRKIHHLHTVIASLKDVNQYLLAAVARQLATIEKLDREIAVASERYG